MPAMVMYHETDPREELIAAIGDLSELKLARNEVLLAVYLRPEKTKSGIILTDNTRGEDAYQSKVGLIVKMGPTAFKDPTGVWFEDFELQMHDWAVFRPSDGWNITVNKVLCRQIEDKWLRGSIPHPDMVW